MTPDRRVDTTSQSAVGAGARRMLLVTGQRRSGTTLVSNLLDAQRGVRVLRDFLGIARLQRRAGDPDLSTPLDDRSREAVAAAFRSQNDLLGLSGEHTRALDSLAPPTESVWSLAEFYEHVLKAAAGADDHVIGHKSTAAEGAIERLLDVIPALQVLCMVRDPRDVVVSGAVRAPDESVVEIVRSWRRGIEAALALRTRRPDLESRLVLLRYEDLVRDPGAVLTDLARWLGLEGATVPAKLGDYGSEWEHNSSFASVGDEVVGTAPIGRHRMAPRLSRLVELELGDLLEELGWDRVEPPGTAESIRRFGTFATDRALHSVERFSQGLGRRARKRRSRIGRDEIARPTDR